MKQIFSSDQTPASPRVTAGHVAGALVWGLFFSFAPIEVLFLGVVVWLPLLIRNERKRSLRVDFFLGGVVRLLVTATVILIAWKATPQFLDRKVKPLGGQVTTLAEVRRQLAEQRVHIYFPDSVSIRRVRLPDREMKVSEMIAEIKTQSGLEKPKIMSCSSGASIYTGPFWAVHFNEPRPTAALPSP